MKDYIKASGSIAESELLNLAEKYICGGSVYAVHTDRFYCGTEPDTDVRHLTELRIFTENSEFKASRFNIGTDFRWRYIEDTEVSEEFTYDEEHFLDVDTKKSDGMNYTTTGGGKYTLPIENAEKVKIRNYLEYDENGIVFFADFRIVGFIKKGEK